MEFRNHFDGLNAENRSLMNIILLHKKCTILGISSELHMEFSI